MRGAPLIGVAAALTIASVAERGADGQALRAAIEKSQQANIVAASVTDSPDWSRLLAVVAHQLGDDVVLGQCNITVTDNLPEIGGKCIDSMIGLGLLLGES